MQPQPSRSPLPVGLRLLNRVGGALRAAGWPLAPLDPATLCARAAAETGLTDFGDERFREPLARLVHALEHEAALTALGRLVARADLVRLLANRLHMVDAHRRHPEIARGAITSPIFILGLPRTGTSILHELLALDPANRVPMTWEAYRIWPPPERATYERDPRIAEVTRNLARVDRILPGFKTMHPMGALLPQECVALTAHEFASMIFHTTHDLPTYQAWLEGTDLRWVYASHRRQLQYLQWRCPAERWVLKSPAHLWALDALLAVYPDARIVQTHRDPLKVVASLASLVAYLRAMASDRVDRLAIARDWTVRLADGLARTMRVRAGGALPPAQVFDVQLSTFVGREIATVERLYAHFGLTLGAEAADRMRRFLAANPKDRHGAHRYTLADAGLDPAVERRRFAAYQERFAVPSEPD